MMSEWSKLFVKINTADSRDNMQTQDSKLLILVFKTKFTNSVIFDLILE